MAVTVILVRKESLTDTDAWYSGPVPYIPVEIRSADLVAKLGEDRVLLGLHALELSGGTSPLLVLENRDVRQRPLLPMPPPR